MADAKPFPTDDDFQHLINRLEDEDDQEDLIKIKATIAADRKQIEELENAIIEYGKGHLKEVNKEARQIRKALKNEE